jgi:hypothetical protein
MLFVPKELIENMRRVVIQLLNLLDDTLGIQRTIPSKEDRYKLRQLSKNDKDL